VAANFNARGNFTGIIGMAKDITEEHELQHQLFQSQKMEAIGTLAGGIAHDFNNLLMGMQANLSLMHLDKNITPSLNDKITRVEDQIKNGANLTRQLLGYARKGKCMITTVHLNRLIEETLTVVQRTNKALRIQSLLSDDPVLIKADKGQIELLLLNLFVNAVDAMPHGGRLTVSTRHVVRNDIQLNGNRKIHYCELMVADTGIGMDSATRKRIFEPFFTTKDVGRGTGLGLASVYGVVQNHGGQIHVESTEGEGTMFTVHLPTTQERIEKKAPSHYWALPSGSYKILLVEDEPLIRKYTLEMIQSLDLSALSAQNGKEAIDLYYEHHDQIDLVILDMIMPGMDGLSVYKALHQIDPNVKIIITSGYATDERFEEILSQGGNACLKKPYTRKELADKIATVLNVEPVELCIVAAESV
jgi:nitrogen-specific signal transduction histidine kinase/ActR/RegA family two-component response regulator